MANKPDQSSKNRFVAFDVETPNRLNHRISSIGITVVEDGRIVGAFSSLVNPQCDFDDFNVQLTGIRPEMVREAPDFPALWQRIEPLMSSGTLVAHNAVFDLGVLKKCLTDYGISWKPTVRYLCTVQIGRRLLPDISHKLNDLCDYYGLALDHHRADSDSNACAEILLKYMEAGDNWKTCYRTFTLAERKSAETVPELPGPETVPVEPEQARQVLARVYGHERFRPGQQEIIQALLQGRDAVCVMPTGSGKSLCYQLPALLSRGTAMVISPLISLMKDQVGALRVRGIPAAFLNSSMSEAEYAETAYRAATGAYKILYVAPERLQSSRFVETCQHMDLSLIAVDEAHCISQWGQDFRPGYLKIPEFIGSLPHRPPVGAFTATATPQVRQDILKHLQLNDPVSVTTGYDRPNLSFSVYEPADRENALLGLLRDRFHQSGIVYCATRKTVEAVCALLEKEGFPATRYHAGLAQEERRQNQEDFLFDRKRVMVATNAFGMGIDKSNVSYVIHFNMPLSLEAYYQEAGRAGRDGCEADCILLYSGQDVILGRWLIDHSEENPDLTEEQRKQYRQQQEERLKWMTWYSKTPTCLRAFILRYFGESAPAKCDNCSNCVPDCLHVDITRQAQMILSAVARTGQRLPEEPTAELLRGVCPQQLPAGIEPQTLTTFGLMKEQTQQTVLDWIQALRQQGYLEAAEEEPFALQLNEASRQVLFHGRRVLVRSMGREHRDAVFDDLFQALQQLRYQLSAEEYIAASALFTDATLRDICRLKPKTKKELAKADGMGVFKANRYGDRILRVVARFETGGGPAGKSAGKPGSHREQVIAEGKAKAYQSWTEKEDQRLSEEFRAGLPLQELADRHHRTRGAILSRLRKLGLT